MAIPAASDEPWVPADTFGSRLALVRNHLGWNVKEAADACSLNDQSWRNWEAGKLPRDLVGTASTIARITGCSMAWLVQGNQNWKLMMAPDLHVLQGGAGADRGSGTPTRAEQLRLRLLTPVT